MPQFDVDEELAAVIERLAKPKPFQNLSFNDALWHVIRHYVTNEATIEDPDPLERVLAEARAKVALTAKKAPTPNVIMWVQSVPELKKHHHLTTWKAVCVHLKIETAGDSARRKLKNWVKANRSQWAPVPDID